VPRSSTEEGSGVATSGVSVSDPTANPQFAPGSPFVICRSVISLPVTVTVVNPDESPEILPVEMSVSPGPKAEYAEVPLSP
jgi:hypothetical protein